MKVYLEIKKFQNNLSFINKLGKKVHFKGDNEKVLVVVAHVINVSENANPEKLERFIACLECLRKTLYTYNFEIVVLSKKNYSLYDMLPEYLKSKTSVYFSNAEDPMKVEFDAFEIYKDKKDLFDYFLFLEDDILIEDCRFLKKIELFNQASPHLNYVLLPHRFEYYRGVKYYIDQEVVKDEVSKRYAYLDFFSVDFGGVKFCIYENSHAAFYCLSKKQIELWVQSGYKWKGKIVAFGPLESAATYTLFENFKFLKPHPECMNYFEVQHYGSKYIIQNKILN